MKIREMEIRELELNDQMIQREDDIENAVYQLLLSLLQLDEKQAEINFPWDIQIIRELLEWAKWVLMQHGHPICDPYIETRGARQFFCTLLECGCQTCNCHGNQMEKERDQNT